MKILGINFSLRKNGNCANSLKYVMEKFLDFGYDIETYSFGDFSITGCGACDYECFKKGNCMYNDDITNLYDSCICADKIVFALPSYGGNLPSSYFAFSERGQGYFMNSQLEYFEDFLDKVEVILIANIEHGALSAMNQLLTPFSNKQKEPMVQLISSVEHGMSSIRHILIESKDVRKKCDDFVDRIISSLNGVNK